ncbi:MAG: hypothetical protein PHC33_00170 [Candidatus Omnitrophica bacterium]|nr:hypothetical protein [Candidatus Omnitrophota bacterium]
MSFFLLKMERLVFFLGLSFCLNCAAVLNAQISPEPREIKLTVHPGGQYRGTIRITNDSDESLIVRAYFEDLVFPPPFDGTKEFRPLGSTAASCGKWITVLPSSFVLVPHGEQEVIYTINAPADVKGGYYGILYFEKMNPPEAVEGLGMSLVYRFGSSFYLETADSDKKAVIEALVPDKNSLKGDFKNTGDVIIFGRGTYQVMDKDGILISRGEFGKFSIPPKEKITFSVNDIRAASFGEKADVIINFDLGDGELVVGEIEVTGDASGGLKISALKN